MQAKCFGLRSFSSVRRAYPTWRSEVKARWSGSGPSGNRLGFTYVIERSRETGRAYLRHSENSNFRIYIVANFNRSFSRRLPTPPKSPIVVSFGGGRSSRPMLSAFLFRVTVSEVVGAEASSNEGLNRRIASSLFSNSWYMSADTNDSIHTYQTNATCTPGLSVQLIISATRF